MAGKYDRERLEALWDRNERLEHAMEVAGAFLETGIGRGTLTIDAPIALAALRAVLQETFRAGLLCTRGTTDDQLDHWLPEADAQDAVVDQAESAARDAGDAAVDG